MSVAVLIPDSRNLAAAQRVLAALIFSAFSIAGHAQGSGTNLRLEPARAPHTMVVSGRAIASEVGDRILRAGGNAVDAAIATGFALAVTMPAAGNIGGGGFMVIRFPDGHATAIDFRETAPLRANPNMFLDSAGKYSTRMHRSSHLAVGVPGTVSGFALAHQKYGSAKWKTLVDPAAKLAREGFVANAIFARSLAAALPDFQPRSAAVKTYTKKGEPYKERETVRFPDLARTLNRIGSNGRDGFYKGETARLIAEEMKRGGGLITEEDLALYEAKERVPVRGSYRGYEIVSMPPPSSGGITLVEILNILEGFDLHALNHNSPQHLHYLAEAMRRAHLDRARFLGDPDFSTVPIERLTSKTYAEKLRNTIDPHRASRSVPADITFPSEGYETTHFSVVDSRGTAVSVTYTLGTGYGSKIVVPGGGFLLNNEMSDFKAQPGLTDTSGLIGTIPNLARPQQRMLSSMAPTILAKDGKLVAVIGTEGGRTIPNTVVQVLSNVVDFGMDIQHAVNATRIHHQWLPDQLVIEQVGAEASVWQLKRMGHDVRWTERAGGTQGRAHSVMIDPKTGARLGAADPRDFDGSAVGH